MTLLTLITLSWIYWDPDRAIFNLPIVDRPIGWYGLLFASGFVYGYFYFIRAVTQKIVYEKQIPQKQARKQSVELADRLLWLIIAGTIIGARLGEVFFYSWDYYKEHPADILKIWQGGLASHGGTLGVMIALAFGYRYAKKTIPNLTFLGLLDIAAVPTGFVVFCIRMGNFINQEIIGSPTQMPWGVVFGNPADNAPIVPRHPVQLYEGFTYLAICIGLTILWEKKGPSLRPGIITGIFFMTVFGSRFIWEFFKFQQEAVIDQSFLQVGQYLSIPFILLGLWLLLRKQKMVRKP